MIHVLVPRPRTLKIQDNFQPRTSRSEHLFTVGLMSIAVLQGRPGRVGQELPDLPVEDHQNWCVLNVGWLDGLWMGCWDEHSLRKTHQ